MLWYVYVAFFFIGVFRANGVRLPAAKGQFVGNRQRHRGRLNFATPPSPCRLFELSK
jgi:hypothetical protein